MNDKWISLREYSKQNQMSPETVKALIHKGDLTARKTEGGHYKILINGDTVSREEFEKEKERRIKAEAMLENIKLLLKIS